MLVTFVSNYFNHHEKPFCDEMYKLTGGNFNFIQTLPLDSERIKLGWNDHWKDIPYVLLSYISKAAETKCHNICYESDVVILGSAPYSFISKRVKENKLTFYYAERLFKHGLIRVFYPPSALKVLKRFIIPGRKSNFYMLCASAYTAFDISRIFSFKNRVYKWSHFPECVEFDIDNLILSKSKDKINILWAGRFIRLKHPEYAIKLAQLLKKDGIKFTLNMIGIGEMEPALKKMVTSYKLMDDVIFLGSMPPEEVRKFMVNANVFIFTSDFNEGWGAVLFEAMNSGCAVVASHAIGAVPFLLKNGENGIIYRNCDFNYFSNIVKMVIEDKKLREKLGRNAYHTISTLWNSKVGAERFLNLSKSAFYGYKFPLYDEGPCSPAKILKNNWF